MAHADADCVRPVLWLEAIRPDAAVSRWTARGVIAVALAMFAIVILMRGAVIEAGASVLVLLSLPVTLIALSFGPWAGLASAVAAEAMIGLWDLTGGDPGGGLGYVSRGTAFLLLGFLPGWLAARVVETQRERRRIDAELAEARRRESVEAERAQQRAERRRYAREANDTIVQGLVATEIALDLGHTDYARSLVRTTSRHARQWIGELLAEEGPLQPGAARRTAAAETPTEPP